VGGGPGHETVSTFGNERERDAWAPKLKNHNRSPVGGNGGGSEGDGHLATKGEEERGDQWGAWRGDGRGDP